MTSTSATIPPVVRLHGGEPLLRRSGDHPWENRVTFNPGCALVTDAHELFSIISSLPFSLETRKRLESQPALCFLLYRAQGERTPEYDHTRSSMGLAVLSPDLTVLARHTAPVILPDQAYDNLGVEDGRITRVGDSYYLFYCAYGSHPDGNRIRIAVASTQDFVHWEKYGLLRGEFNNIQNKNAMLCAGKVNGEFVLLHRPMEGQQAMSIHWATSPDILGPWTDRGLLMPPRPNPEFKDTWIGGGAPPLLLQDGRYLVVYHIGNRKHDGTREYDLGIALADFARTDVIIKRAEPLLRPETPGETQGDAALGVNNVVFICGAYFYDDGLYFPYAGADSVILGGMIRKKQLAAFVKE